MGAQGFADDVRPARSRQATLERTQDALGRFLADRQGENRCLGVVLGLCQQLAGDGLEIGMLFGDRQDFTWAGGGVDSHPVRNLELRFRHVGVAGADDPIHARDGLGAIGHRPNRARAPDGEDPVDLRKLRRREDDRQGQAGIRGGRADDDSDSGHPGGDSAHQHAARIGGAAAGCVHSDPAQRIGPTPDADSGLRLQLALSRAKGLMRSSDVVVRSPQALKHGGRGG